VPGVAHDAGCAAAVAASSNVVAARSKGTPREQRASGAQANSIQISSSGPPWSPNSGAMFLVEQSSRVTFSAVKMPSFLR
jgi:hypothetical protein